MNPNSKSKKMRAIIVLVAFLASIDAYYNGPAGLGLRCNTCVATKEKLGFCRVMHCKSMDDVRKGYAELKKHPGFKGEMPDVTQNTTEFVCVRTLGKTTPGGPPDYIYSFCAPRVPDLPPSEEPYSKSAIREPEMRSFAGNVDVDGDVDPDGQVYVCNEKTGYGPNCGPGAIVGAAYRNRKQ